MAFDGRRTQKHGGRSFHCALSAGADAGDRSSAGAFAGFVIGGEVSVEEPVLADEASGRRREFPLARRLLRCLPLRDIRRGTRIEFHVFLHPFVGVTGNQESGSPFNQGLFPS